MDVGAASLAVRMKALSAAFADFQGLALPASIRAIRVICGSGAVSPGIANIRGRITDIRLRQAMQAGQADPKCHSVFRRGQEV